jgi:membrane-associated phospholipid phosphatase
VLTDHRRALVYTIALLSAMALLFVAVGRHPPAVAPRTTFAPIGRIDLAVYRWMDDARVTPLVWLARALSIVGGGGVTIPLRIGVAAWLAVRVRWRALAAWLVTWFTAEIVLTWTKAFFHRGRPPAPLVAITGYSFPSGHAVAASATAVALVLVLLPSGPERRIWEAVAVGFAFLMALSRVYLNAHWLSDVVAGTLLGTGVALGSAALATEVRHRWIAGRPISPEPAGPRAPPRLDSGSEWSSGSGP